MTKKTPKRRNAQARAAYERSSGPHSSPKRPEETFEEYMESWDGESPEVEPEETKETSGRLTVPLQYFWKGVLR